MFDSRDGLTGVRLAWMLCALIGVCLSANRAEAQKRIYLAPDDHTDLIWAAGESAYQQAFLDMLDYHLDRIDATQGASSEHQARWNCDGHYWLWVYEKNRSAAQFDRLISRIADGHVSAPLNALTITPGSAPTEAILRGMYYPGKLQRQYGIDFPLAYAMENQTLSLGLISLWAGSGAKYTWKGICDCDTRIPDAADRDNEIYWAQGLDGRRMLMKWNSMLVSNDGIGGYAEARDPYAIVDFVDTNSTFIARYPWNVIGAFGQGWDDVLTLNDNVRNAAVSKTTAPRLVIVSNEVDFFDDFEAMFGNDIPTETLSYGNEWDLYAAAFAKQTGRIRRAAETLRGAEALAAIALRVDPAFDDGREAARDQAWMNFGLFWEHNGGMVDAPTGAAGQAERIQWQKRLVDEIEAYVDPLLTDARAAVAGAIDNPSGTDRFCVFNPLGWTRSDAADLPYIPSGSYHVVDLLSGLEVPSQTVQVDGQTFARILASNLPSLGYKVFEIRSGSGQAWSDAAAFSGGDTLETAAASVQVDGGGAIVSWVDKTRGNREWIANIDGRDANDRGGAIGSISLENSGPVSATLRVDSTSGPEHVSRITVYAHSPRIDIRNEITENFATTETWDFSFNLSNPDVWHEELGAVLHVCEAPDGHYASRASRLDWLTLNHFIDMTGDGPAGVTLANQDCAFARLGASSISSLDVNTPQISVLVGGRVANGSNGIPDQAGDTSFLQRFALIPHDAYVQGNAMRAALESQNPPIAESMPQTGGSLPADQFSMISVGDPDSLIWAVKPFVDSPADQIAARVWNQTDSANSYTVRSGGFDILEAWETTHIETPIQAETVSNGNVAAVAPPQGMQTHLFRVQLATVAPDPTPTPTPTPLPYDPRPYIQGGPSDHLVIMESEGYHDRRATVSNAWLEDNRLGGESGGLAMAAAPNIGVNNSGAGVENSTPTLDYLIDFNQTGTHYVWVRSHNQNSGGDDSLHVGLDGVIQPATRDMFNVVSNVWHWDGQDARDFDRYLIDVPSTDLHTLNLFMREDGVVVDKVILTVDPGYTPIGSGPGVSPRSGTPSPTPTATPTPEGDTGVDGWRRYMSRNSKEMPGMLDVYVRQMRTWKLDRLR